MADVSITPANVASAAAATRARREAGATITAGKMVFRDPSTFKSGLADCDSATAAVRSPEGIALNGASDGQPLDIHTEGDITIGGTLTPGLPYYLSPTAGGICPIGDLSTGDYITFVGIAISESVLRVKIIETGVQV